MLESIKQHGRDDEQGFTLIELMVVVLIIAILLAIAIPTFLGATKSANARSSQSNLRNSLTAEQSYWTDNQLFTATGATLQAIEPSIGWSTGAVATEGGNTVSVTLGTNTTAGDTVFLQAYAKDGNCYTIVQTNDPAITAAQHTGYSVVSGACAVPTTLTFPTVNSGKAVAGGGFYQSW